MFHLTHQNITKISFDYKNRLKAHNSYLKIITQNTNIEIISVNISYSQGLFKAWANWTVVLGPTDIISPSLPQI